MTKEYKSSCKMSLESQNFSALEHSTKQKKLLTELPEFLCFLTPNCTSLLSSPVIAYLSNATLVYPPDSVASVCMRFCLASLGGEPTPVLQ